MTDNNAVIMMVVLLVLGAKLVGTGITGLSGVISRSKASGGGQAQTRWRSP